MVLEQRESCDDPSCCDGNDPPLSNVKGCALAEKCVLACAAHGRVCPYAAHAASRAACKAIKALSEDSEVFKGTPDLGSWNCDDLVIGKLLGSGGFSEVHEVSIRSDEGKNKRPLAVKFLKRKVMVDRRLFELGAADLAVEAHFLAILSHKNIICLHGVTAGAVETNIASGKECGYFILIDRLFDTLEQRIGSWKDDNGELQHAGLLYRRTHQFRERRREFLAMRIMVALQIVDALMYLHSFNIVYRDVKPDNIGFDYDGVVKLFDFGLAKELKRGTADEFGLYKLTGNTGSRRYMAPEVARSMHYNLSVDIYSFGILLWEICALEKPFSGYSAMRHMQEVVMMGQRPKMDGNHAWWPVSLQRLIKQCWATRIVKRPTMEVVKQLLQGMLQEATPGKTDEEGDAEQESRREEQKEMKKPTRRRSTTWVFSNLRGSYSHKSETAV